MTAMVLGVATTASAANILYLHGRSMTQFPPEARLRHSASWTDVLPSYPGSTRLGDVAVQTTVRNAIVSACTAADCVIVCYSAGCARA